MSIAVVVIVAILLFGELTVNAGVVEDQSFGYVYKLLLGSNNTETHVFRRCSFLLGLGVEGHLVGPGSIYLEDVNVLLPGELRLDFNMSNGATAKVRNSNLSFVNLLRAPQFGGSMVGSSLEIRNTSVGSNFLVGSRLSAQLVNSTIVVENNTWTRASHAELVGLHTVRLAAGSNIMFSQNRLQALCPLFCTGFKLESVACDTSSNMTLEGNVVEIEGYQPYNRGMLIQISSLVGSLRLTRNTFRIDTNSSWAVGLEAQNTNLTVHSFNW